MINRINVPKELKKVYEIFKKAGFSVYLVGGAVRDELLGKKNHDWDLATDAKPEQVMSLFRRVIPTGIAHGTVTVLINGLSLETTTFRTETTYSDGRHPDSVNYTSNLEEDLSRRDFTMNAIAADLGTGILTDPFGGREDIKKGIIRTVGNPVERFTEDGLRPVRAIRFASRLGFSIEEKTLEALSNPLVLKKTAGVSTERFRDEFCKMLESEKPSAGLKLLEQAGIMDIFIPEFKLCRGCIQNDGRGFHEFDVADHLIYSCDGAPRENLFVRLAAFFHDFGKPDVCSIEKKDGAELYHFYRHEEASEKKCRSIMTRLKFSNLQIEKVCLLVKEHMFYYESSWSNGAVRRFLVRVGEENVSDLIALRQADVYGMHCIKMDMTGVSGKLLLELQDRIENLKKQGSALTLKDLSVNGKDLMALGIPHGKILGLILNELLETVLDSPEMNEKEKLLKVAEGIYKAKSPQ